MISVESILYKLDQKLNKLSTNEHQQIPLEDKILYANEAQIKVLLSKVNTEDSRRLGMDAFLKNYHDLEVLVESWIPRTLAEKSFGDSALFVADLDSLEAPLMFYIDSYILADKGRCLNKVLYTNLVAHGNVLTLLRNNHHKPSFEYQETLVTLSKHHLEVYTDGTFTPKEAHVSYLRYPKEIDYEGYVRLDGSDSQNQDSELPDYMLDELVDVAEALITKALIGRNASPNP